jgi:hypothetical protein
VCLLKQLIATIYRCSDSYSDTVLGYANSIRTIDGGTHIEGLKTSLTRTINNLAKKSKTIKVITDNFILFLLFSGKCHLFFHILNSGLLTLDYSVGVCLIRTVATAACKYYSAQVLLVCFTYLFRRMKS